MRQTTLTERLTINKHRHRTNTDTLVQILQNEEELAFHAVMPGARPAGRDPNHRTGTF